MAFCETKEHVRGENEKKERKTMIKPKTESSKKEIHKMGATQENIQEREQKKKNVKKKENKTKNEKLREKKGHTCKNKKR